MAAKSVNGVAEHMKTFGLGRYLERRQQQRTGMIVLHEVLETRQYTAHFHKLIFALTQTAELQHLLQHEGVSRGPRIHSQGLTSQVGIGCDFRYGHQPQKTVVATHDGYKVGLHAD
jgi:hypothetical protein